MCDHMFEYKWMEKGEGRPEGRRRGHPKTEATITKILKREQHYHSPKQNQKYKGAYIYFNYLPKDEEDIFWI